MARHRARITQSRRSGWRSRLAFIAAGAVGGAMVAGIAGAAAPQNATGVTFVPIVPFKLLTNVSIAANKTLSKIVIGGTTTVPSDATSVKLNVTAGGTAAGALNFFPAGDLSGGSGQYLSWNAGGTDSGTIEEHVGTSNELSFYNVSSAAAHVTATIVGYSTQVTTDDISPAGGTSGQVLTNTGTGTSWQTVSPSYEAADTFPVTISASEVWTPIVTLTVPPGNYQASVTASVTGPLASIEVDCVIGPQSNPSDAFAEMFTEISPTAPVTSLSEQGLFTTATSETIGFYCNDGQLGEANLVTTALIATQVGSINGNYFGN